eukprot:TRINITY_DN2455_c0_g1_i5.p1 TRINITY_DN2455_c0_g1~~TRINITY_DN2455_c0_g1_i5.p1  ORF type:complete len:212 (-),score=38.26 TRINITY_DN2455_c0_g1_i5:645-1280(-)
MSIITSFFPSIFACIRPNQQSSAPLRSQSFDFFNSLDYDEETGNINVSKNDKKRKSRNSFLRSSSTKGRHSLSCIGTRNKKVDNIQQTSTHCGLEARVNNDLMQIRADPPESPKSISETSDSSSRQLLSSTDSDDFIQSPKRVVLPRIEINFTAEDIDDIKDLTLQLVLSCIRLKEVIERTEMEEYVSSVKVGAVFKTSIIKIPNAHRESD